jgi:hypothetical protein
MQLTFTDEEIVKLFGHEEAEREDRQRLIEYFFKNDAYRRVRANLQLRILVGYKGVGKSALFRVCDSEDKNDGIASVLIKPDDIAEISSDQADLNLAIRRWKEGIQEIIFRKVAGEFGRLPDDSESALINYGNGFLQSLIALANNRIGRAADPAKSAMMRAFLNKKRLVVYVDDLDSGWKGSTAETTKISALLSAVRHIIADTPGIFFRIALRSDVFDIIRMGCCRFG